MLFLPFFSWKLFCPVLSYPKAVYLNLPPDNGGKINGGEYFPVYTNCYFKGSLSGKWFFGNLIYIELLICSV